MIINIELDFNPETESVKIKSCKINKDTVAPKSADVVDAEPRLVLDSNKYTLNDAAIALMGIKVDERIDIKYQVVNGVETPIIGSESAFGSGGGNKLTKSNTISYRGKANAKLATFGTDFIITKLPDYDNLFALTGNIPAQEPTVSDEIEIIEDTNTHTDIVTEESEPLTFDDDNSFSFEVNEDDESVEITEDTFDFE